MCYAYTVTNEASRLHDLDDLLASVRVALQRPTYRRKLLSGLDVPGGITTLRLLRAVEFLSVDEEPSIGDVATRLAVEHSTASRSVDAAVRSGLLSKHACAQDLRRTRLDLTSQGRTLLKKASARRRELLGDITQGWPAEDIDQLVELLDALRLGFDRLESSQ